MALVVRTGDFDDVSWSYTYDDVTNRVQSFALNNPNSRLVYLAFLNADDSVAEEWTTRQDSLEINIPVPQRPQLEFSAITKPDGSTQNVLSTRYAFRVL